MGFILISILTNQVERHYGFVQMRHESVVYPKEVLQFSRHAPENKFDKIDISAIS